MRLKFNYMLAGSFNRNVNIEILRDSLPVVTYTRGKIRVTDGIEHAMSVLRLASDFEYEYDIETATVYVR